METSQKLFCTICGDFIQNPATLPTCFDCFCQPCIQQFIEVTEPFLKHRRNCNDSSGPQQHSDIISLPCPNCDTIFRENSVIKNFARTKTLSSKKILNMEADIKDAIKMLKTCQEKFSLVISKLMNLHKIKMEHFSSLLTTVECLAKNLMEKIKEETNSLLRNISKMKTDFQSTITAELGYYKFLNENAGNLAAGLNHLLKVKEDDLRNNYNNCCHRLKKIESSSLELTMSTPLLCKFKLKIPKPETLVILEPAQDIFRIDDESDLCQGLNICSLFSKKKWSYRLQGISKSSSLPQGICFWPNDNCFVVSEYHNGTILGFYVDKLRPEKPYNVLTKQDNFLPTTLIRMDKGAAWSFGSERNIFPNLAMIDKRTEKIAIFNINDKKFSYPMSQKFDLLKGLAYFAIKDGNFLVTDEFHKRLEMISITGSSIWRVGDKNSSVFSEPHHIAVDYDRNQILVTDNADLHFFDFNGQHLRKVSSPSNLKKWCLGGISVMRTGEILVAEGNESLILQLDSRDERFVEKVLEGDGVKGVKCMDVSSDSHLAMVCGDGLISVYKL